MASNWDKYNATRREKRRNMTKEEKTREALEHRRYSLTEPLLSQWERITAEIRMRLNNDG